jgi:hypothetical protein
VRLWVHCNPRFYVLYAPVPLFPSSLPSRSVIHDTGSDVYSLTGKRWNEAGTLSLRVSLGGHGEAVAGGVAAFTVVQTGSQDLLTC